MKVMKSVKKQPDERIKQFKVNTKKLNQAIQSLIEKPPVPGCKLKHSRQLKSHLLFNGEIQRFLEKWGILGGLNEQNTEGTHPQFNNFARQFGNSRGAFKKKMMMTEFLFGRSSWIVDGIDGLLESTKGSKRKKKVISVVSEAVDDGGDLVGIEQPWVGMGADSAAGNRDQPDVEEMDIEEDEVVEEVNEDVAVGNLTEFEKSVNHNQSLCKAEFEVDTCLKVCPNCGKRLLGFAMGVQLHESHSSITKDADGVESNHHGK